MVSNGFVGKQEINIEVDRKVQQWIEVNRREIVEEWMELCRIPSVVCEGTLGTPFGVEVKKALDFSKKFFEKHGLPVRMESDAYLVSDYGNGENVLGLFAHADVVAGGEGWIYTKPFEPVIIQDTLIGRGVGDNKSGVMAIIALMRIFRDLKIPLRLTIRGVVGSAEEVGSPDMKEYLGKEKLPDLSLVLDAHFPCCIGERGIFNFKIRSKKTLQKIRALYGGTSSNVIPAKTVMELDYESGLYEEILKKAQDQDNISVNLKEQRILVEAQGLSAHMSKPERGINSTSVLANFMKNVTGLDSYDRELMESVAFLLSDVYGKNLNINFRDDNFGSLTISNGTTEIEEGHIILSFQIRYGTARSPEWLEAQLKNATKEQQWEVFDMNNRVPFRIPGDSAIPMMLTDIYNEMSGIPAQEPFYMGGKSYASPLFHANPKKLAIAVGTCVGETTDGFLPGLEMPKGHGGAHGPDEKISIDAFFEAVRVLVQYIIAV